MDVWIRSGVEIAARAPLLLIAGLILALLGLPVWPAAAVMLVWAARLWRRGYCGSYVTVEDGCLVMAIDRRELLRIPVAEIEGIYAEHQRAVTEWPEWSHGFVRPATMWLVAVRTPGQTVGLAPLRCGDLQEHAENLAGRLRAMVAADRSE